MPLIGNYGNNGQITVSTIVAGGPPVIVISVTPNLADTADDYKLPAPPADPTGAPQRLNIPGIHNPEDFRLDDFIIKVCEEQCELGMTTEQGCSISIDEAVTPKWVDQLRWVVFNAYRGRQSTHEFIQMVVPGGVCTYTAQELP